MVSNIESYLGYRKIRKFTPFTQLSCGPTLITIMTAAIGDSFFHVCIYPMGFVTGPILGVSSTTVKKRDNQKLIDTWYIRTTEY